MGANMTGPKPVAVITGAAQGIGRRIAELFAERGYDLAIIDIRSAADTMHAVRDRGAAAIELLGDISDDASVLHFAAKVQTFRGRVDALINNAGISCICPGRNSVGSRLSARPGSKSGRPISAGQSLRIGHAPATQRQHHQHRVGRRAFGNRGSRRV
jgi:NAD(P)-dependent dehydrogenase (short-subunit alcohol dehydrogenase family)